MNGEIAYIEAGSFQGSDGKTIPYHDVIVNGRKYRAYGKKIAEKKVGDIIEFEIEEKGEGKTPKLKLADDSGSKQWTPRGKSEAELDLERIKIKAMLMAYAKDIQVAGGVHWSITFADMVPVVFGNDVKPTTKQDKITTKEDVPDFEPPETPFYDPPVNSDSAPATEQQLGAIYSMSAKLRCQPPQKIRQILKDPKKDVNSLTYGEAARVITVLDKEVRAIGK